MRQEVDLVVRLRPLVSRAVVALVLVLVGGCAVKGDQLFSPREMAAARPQDYQSVTASAAGREAERAQAREALVRALSPQATAAEVVQALTALQVLQTDLAHVPALLPRLFDLSAEAFAALPPGEQHARLALAHGLDAALVAPQVQRLLPLLRTPREFATAAAVLLRADARHAQPVREHLLARTDGDEPRLQALRLRLELATAPHTDTPPLADLFSPQWLPGRPLVISLQRRDRRHPGLALVRGADGRWVREADGRLFQVRQLALAASELPGTLTNGNTPQGLFTVVGAAPAQSNRWIGPTPFLWSKLPIEATPAEFLHTVTEGPWTRELYASQLPAGWRGHPALYEAWLAGQAGRSELLMHGMTQDPRWSDQRPWAPLAPSAGCLVAEEAWSADGWGERSHQLRLVQAFMRDGHERGYLLVVEIDDAARPVQLADVAEALRAVGEAAR